MYLYTSILYTVICNYNIIYVVFFIFKLFIRHLNTKLGTTNPYDMHYLLWGYKINHE